MEKTQSTTTAAVDLGAIASMAAAADQAAPVTATAGGASPVAGLPASLEEMDKRSAIDKEAAQISGLVFALASALAPALPSLGSIYTQETCDGIGGVLGALCVKHGWNVGGKYAEEVAAVAVLAPVGYMTFKGVSHDIGKMKAASVKAEAKKPAIAGEGAAPGADVT